MVATSKIPNPLLEIGALSDVGQPIASYGSKLDEDSRTDGQAWLRGVVGVDPRLVLWSTREIRSRGRQKLTIDCFIGSHFGGGMIVGVIPPFRQR